jgi:hypothetical protein
MSASTIIVGNGSTLLGKGLGEEIDSFERVLRFNDFDIGPEYAADYGVRVTDHVMALIVFREYCAGLRESKAPVIVAHCKGAQVLCPAEVMLGDFNPTPPTLILPGHIHKETAEHFERYKMKGDPIRCCSSGMFMMFYAISYWKRPVAVAGFDFGETGHYFDKNHQHGNHRWSVERRMFDSLVKSDLVVELGGPL